MGEWNRIKVVLVECKRMNEWLVEQSGEKLSNDTQL